MSKIKATTGPVYRYNPSLKPVKYKPGVPVVYHGFPPHAGWTYSSVECNECSNKSVIHSSHNNFCPSCGGKTLAKLEDEITSNLKEEIQCSLEHDCSRCGTHQVVGMKDFNKLHCVECGTDLPETLSQFKKQLKEKSVMDQKTKAALLTTIEDLKKRGHNEVAADLEKELLDEGQEETGMNPDAAVAALDSGVDQEVPTGNREEDAKEMIEDEKVNPAPVQEIDPAAIKAVAQVEALMKFGVPTVVRPDGNGGYNVLAADALDEEIKEEQAEEVEQPEILDEATAQLVVDFNQRNGKSTRVTRVESGYVVETLASEETEGHGQDKVGDAAVKNSVDPVELPEEKSEIDKTVVAVKYEETAGEDCVEEKADDAEDQEPAVLDEQTAYAAIAKFHSEGKDASITRVEGGYVVTAVADEEVKEEELAADMSDEQIKQAVEETKLPEDKAKEEGAEPEIMDEHLAMATAQLMVADGKAAKITRVSKAGYVVAEVAPEEMLSEDVIEEEVKEIKQEAQDDAEKTLEQITSTDEEAKEEMSDDQIKQEVKETDLPEDKAKEQTAEEVKEDLKTFDGKEEEMKAANEEEHKEEELKAEEPKEEEMMAFATLVAPSELVVASEDDVTMILSEKNDNLFYTVLVHGEPVAKIELNAQPKPEQIAEYFPTEAYAMDLVDAMKKIGVKKTLESVKAHFYANEIVPANAQEKISAAVKDEFDKKYAEAVASIRDDLADRIALEIAANNKNIYKDVPHQLKAALYEAVLAEQKENKNGRLSETDVVAALDKGFEDGAAPFFGMILDRAVAKLDMSNEALAEFKKLVGEANVQSLEYVLAADDEAVEQEAEESEDSEQQTYAEVLASKNVPVASSSIDKEEIRKKLHFRNRF